MKMSETDQNNTNK